MHKRTTLRVSMNAVTLVALSILSGCAPQDEAAGPAPNRIEMVEQKSVAVSSTAIEGSSEEGAEGANAELDLATNDIAYLTQLGLMRGHLWVGNELYKAGHLEHAKTHMKHPKSELYADVESAFSVRNSDGFAEELEALANAVEGEQGDEAVAEAYAAVTKAIAANEKVVEESSKQAAARLKLASELLLVAGEEYAIAVVDGKMQNAHEYQDALGFTEVAKSILAVSSGDPTAESVLKQGSALLETLSPMWPSLIPPDELKTDASTLYGTAAKVEQLGLSLR